MEVPLELTRLYKEALMSSYNVLRVGFTRLNFNYFITDEEIDYILKGIEFVAKYGWMLLPYYEVSSSGNWSNKNDINKPIKT